MSDAVPEVWRATTINETCDVLDSKRIPLNSQERALHYPYYGANGVQGYIDDFIFDGEHMLLAEDGGYFDEYVFRPISYLVSGKFWVNNHAHILKEKGEHETKYIHYSLVHKNILKHINGGTRSKLNQSDMREIEYLAPPLSEQQKIAAILSSVDEVIEKTRAQIGKLKDLKTAMMQELLTKGIGHREFKDSPVGRIPAGWKVKKFNRIFGFKNGVNKGKESFGHGVPIISYRNVYDGSGIKSLVEMNEAELPRFSCLYGDVFFTRTSETQDEIGYANVYLGGRDDVVYSGFVIRARQTDRVLHPKYCKYAFQSHSIREQILHNSKYTTRAGISSEGLSCIKVCVPPIDEQVKIANSIGSIDGRISCQSQRLKSVCLIKKALMQDLLIGKVRVNVEQKEPVMA